MTSRDELIEEAAKAILVAADCAPGYWADVIDFARRDAEAALEVFEKAQKPSAHGCCLHDAKVIERPDFVMPEPQGEPSDAQVLAALNARWQASRAASHFPDAADAPDLSYFGPHAAVQMRAALRAAGIGQTHE